MRLEWCRGVAWIEFWWRPQEAEIIYGPGFEHCGVPKPLRRGNHTKDSIIYVTFYLLMENGLCFAPLTLYTSLDKIQHKRALHKCPYCWRSKSCGPGLWSLWSNRFLQCTQVLSFRFFSSHFMSHYILEMREKTSIL